MKKHREEATGAFRLVRPLVFGTAAGIVVGAVLLLAAAAVMAAVNVPAAAVTPVALLAMSVAALAGGFAAARVSREKGLLYGAGCGLLMFLIIAVVGFSVEQSVGGSLLFLKLALAVGLGALGGILGVNLHHR